MSDDETKELNLEERSKTAVFKQDYDPSACKKKKAGDYYQCKEFEKGPLCSRAMSILGKYYCPRGDEK